MVMLNYNKFQKINEIKKSENIDRKELSMGDIVLTRGVVDGVDINNEIGKIIMLKEYGNILIEFNDSFSDNLHSGHDKIGKDKHCWYVPINNILTNDPKKIEKIIKELEKDKKRLNEKYNSGDIIIGVDKVNRINIEGEIGIIYNTMNSYGNNKNNEYWIGFFNKLKGGVSDPFGIPRNMSGFRLNKMNIRHINDEEKIKFDSEIDYLRNDYRSSTAKFEVNDVVVVKKSDVLKNKYGDTIINQIGIVIQKQNPNNYFIKFNDVFSGFLNNGNGLIGNNQGLYLSGYNLRSITEEEYEKNKSVINYNREETELYKKVYKVGDFITTRGKMNGVDLNGQFGEIVSINGNFPNENFLISFIDKFNNQLIKRGTYDNCFYILRYNIDPVTSQKAIELKQKLDNKEILSYKDSGKLSLLLNKLNFKIVNKFSNMSFFDVGDKNDMISYLPLDKYKRLESNDDPYSSRLRQIMKVGKFLKFLSGDLLSEKDIENYVNKYKALYQTYIIGLNDKLKLVSGEDIRFWYNEKNYVKGGGVLNSSCMRYESKGKEMQMFVDNPKVIQMLIMVNDDNKLLGRALVWRLAIPSNTTFMDYIYTRNDSDAELFMLYAKSNNWLTANESNLPSKMVCILQNNKKYQMGKNALDHFDTLYNINTEYNYVYKGNVSPSEVKPLINREDTIYELPFEINSRVIYNNVNNKNNGKHGVFMGLDKSGRIKIIFDDGVKLLATEEFVKKEK